MKYNYQGLQISVTGSDGAYECEVTTASGTFLTNGFSNVSKETAIKNAFSSLKNIVVCKYKEANGKGVSDGM